MGDLEEILFPDNGEGQKPGEGSGEETPNKPGKDWNDLIAWDKLEELLGKGEEGQKLGQGNECQKPGTGDQETWQPRRGEDW